MEVGLFAVFLLVAAVQDLRKKQVECRIYLLFGALGALVSAWRFIEGYCLAGAGSVWMLADHGGGVCLGLFMLGASAVTRGGIGAGDGCFFLVSGLLLSFGENLALLCYGVIFCGVYCLALLVYNRLHGGKDVRKHTVPFLPFVALPGIAMVMGKLAAAWR